MDRHLHQTALAQVCTLFLFGLGEYLSARYIQSTAATGAILFLGFGFLAATLSWFLLRLQSAEAEEKLAFEELNKAKRSAALFNSEQLESFPARRAREQFERFFVPGATTLLFLLQAGAAYWLWQKSLNAPAPLVERATLGMAAFAFYALLLFLLGKYSLGLSRLRRERLLRPGAGYLMLGAFTALAVVGAEAAMWFGYPRLDTLVARAFCVILTLAAVETCFHLILEIYRPRIKGQSARLLYESRLIGLLGQPGGLVTTAAQALDYQFGFKISDTWAYRFLERALAWILLLQLALLLLFTTFVIIEPGEQALLERFGRPVSGRALLDPGLHFKLPWPMEKVFRHRTSQLQSFTIGLIHDEHEADEKIVLWTKRHAGEEFNLLVASRDAAAQGSGEQAVPVNLLTVSIPVHFRITNLVDWVYHHHRAGALLEKLGNREVVNFLVSVDIDDLMGSGRLRAAQTLRQRLQLRAEEAHLGVEIVFVGLEDIHPPVKVADAYEAVIGAVQEKASKVLNAEALRAQTVPLARAEAERKLSQARAYRASKLAAAAAQATQFTNQLTAYQASPAVFTRRSYLETLSRSLGPARKLMLGATNTQDVITLNLEDKVRPDLLDITLPPPATP